MRIFNSVELSRLDTACRGYLIYLEQIGILSPLQREIVIDRLMALDAGEIDVEQVKWVTLMVLFSQAEAGKRLRPDGRPGIRGEHRPRQLTANRFAGRAVTAALPRFVVYGY